MSRIGGGKEFSPRSLGKPKAKGNPNSRPYLGTRVGMGGLHNPPQKRPYLLGGGAFGGGR